MLDRNIEVDGIPKHPQDLRRRSEGWHHRQMVRPRGTTGGGESSPYTIKEIVSSGPPGSEEGGDVLDDTAMMMENASVELGEEDGMEMLEQSMQNSETGLSDENVQEQLPEPPRSEVRQSSRNRQPPQRWGEFIAGEELETVETDQSDLENQGGM